MIDYDILLLQNPWWQDKLAINRDQKILEYNQSLFRYEPKQILDLDLRPGDINILMGPRQTGKSTAIKLRIQELISSDVNPKHIFYFNCDALESRQDLIELVRNYLNTIDSTENRQPYIFLDEVSSVDDWAFAVKWLVDEGLLRSSYTILTGSSSISLRKSGEYLPGRRGNGKDILYLPISFADYFSLIHPEIETPKDKKISSLEQFSRNLKDLSVDIDQLWQEFLFTGGFLKMINSVKAGLGYESVVELYKNALKSELAKFGKKEASARAVLIKIIDSLTSETSYTSVASEAELGSKNTAVNYLGFFTDSFLLDLVPFYNIQEQRIVLKKNKKFYPTDPLLLWIYYAFNLGSNNIASYFKLYDNEVMRSRLAETFVASELYKKQLDHYFSQSSQEIDFYIPENNQAIEVKYRNKITPEYLRTFPSDTEKILITKHDLGEEGDVKLVPVSLAAWVLPTKNA